MSHIDFTAGKVICQFLKDTVGINNGAAETPFNWIDLFFCFNTAYNTLIDNATIVISTCPFTLSLTFASAFEVSG